jgi:hypothetical protein
MHLRLALPIPGRQYISATNMADLYISVTSGRLSFIGEKDSVPSHGSMGQGTFCYHQCHLSYIIRYSTSVDVGPLFNLCV